jgi:hypothetical protein
MVEKGVSVKDIVSQWFIRSVEIFSGLIGETLSCNMGDFVNAQQQYKKSTEVGKKVTVISAVVIRITPTSFTD